MSDPDIKRIEDLIDDMVSSAKESMTDRVQMVKECLDRVGDKNYSVNDTLQYGVKMWMANVKDLANWYLALAEFAGTKVRHPPGGGASTSTSSTSGASTSSSSSGATRASASGSTKTAKKSTGPTAKKSAGTAAKKRSG
jgi:hypothetical protein